MLSQKEAVNICGKHILITSDDSFTSFGKITYILLASLVLVLFNNFCTSAGVNSLRKKLWVLWSFRHS